MHRFLRNCHAVVATGGNRFWRNAELIVRRPAIISQEDTDGAPTGHWRHAPALLQLNVQTRRHRCRNAFHGRHVGPDNCGLWRRSGRGTGAGRRHGGWRRAKILVVLDRRRYLADRVRPSGSERRNADVLRRPVRQPWYERRGAGEVGRGSTERLVFRKLRLSERSRNGGLWRRRTRRVRRNGPSKVVGCGGAWAVDDLLTGNIRWWWSVALCDRRRPLGTWQPGQSTHNQARFRRDAALARTERLSHQVLHWPELCQRAGETREWVQLLSAVVRCVQSSRVVSGPLRQAVVLVLGRRVVMDSCSSPGGLSDVVMWGRQVHPRHVEGRRPPRWSAVQRRGVRRGWQSLQRAESLQRLLRGTRRHSVCVPGWEPQSEVCLFRRLIGGRCQEPGGWRILTGDRRVDDLALGRRRIVQLFCDGLLCRDWSWSA